MFKKNEETSTTPSNFEIARDLSSIKPYVDKAATLLGIEMPTIKIYPFIIYTPYGELLARNFDPNIEGYIQASADAEHGLVKLSNFNAMYFIIRQHFTEKKIQTYDSLNSCAKEYRDEELLFNIMHEFRHLYQFKHDTEAYLHSVKPVDWEKHAKDTYEADADAFATVFMDKFTNYNKKNYMQQAWEAMLVDGGRRKQQIRKIKKQLK